ncbi:MAG TPA: amino acid permease, partial [Nitrospirota bacterium]|nr:amino acid permease [Nitrospirota bacterium]
MELKRQLGPATGIFVIIADMIGTGIFMTTGVILETTRSALLVLALWGAGGLAAISGALCYAELASRWPEAGGEYAYLRNIYGRLPAFLTGWISLVVGFSAPAAVSSLLLVQYMGRFFHGIAGAGASAFPLDSTLVQKFLAVGLVMFFGAVHMISVKRGSSLQNALTAIKVVLVLLLIVIGFSQADWSMTRRLTAQYDPAPGAGQLVLQSGLALLVVMYAYSGWNCAAYLGGEIVEPEKNLPRALLSGTAVTAVLYILLNVLFLMSADGASIMGKEEVGAVA